jgi:hypothetical protein
VIPYWQTIRQPEKIANQPILTDCQQIGVEHLPQQFHTPLTKSTLYPGKHFTLKK